MAAETLQIQMPSDLAKLETLEFFLGRMGSAFGLSSSCSGIGVPDFCAIASGTSEEDCSGSTAGF